MKWIAAVTSAVAAAFGVMLLDVGVVVWSALVSAGFLTATCSDVFTAPTAEPLCAPPTSLTLVWAATAVAVAPPVGVLAYRLAGRRSRTPGT